MPWHDCNPFPDCTALFCARGGCGSSKYTHCILLPPAHSGSWSCTARRMDNGGCKWNHKLGTDTRVDAFPPAALRADSDEKTPTAKIWHVSPLSGMPRTLYSSFCSCVRFTMPVDGTRRQTLYLSCSTYEQSSRQSEGHGYQKCARAGTRGWCLPRASEQEISQRIPRKLLGCPKEYAFITRQNERILSAHPCARSKY